MRHIRSRKQQTCRACELALSRKNRVIGRGEQPADVLFVGEAPGRVEDLRGEAFVGPAGRILDSAIADALQIAELRGVKVRYYISNIVQCRPVTLDGGNREPTGEEAWACLHNLMDVYTQTKPKRVVLLGRVAERYAGKIWPSAHVLQHPAYILRRGGTEAPEYRAFVRGLVDIFKEVYNEVDAKGRRNPKRVK